MQLQKPASHAVLLAAAAAVNALLVDTAFYLSTKVLLDPYPSGEQLGALLGFGPFALLPLLVSIPYVIWLSRFARAFWPGAVAIVFSLAISTLLVVGWILWNISRVDKEFAAIGGPTTFLLAFPYGAALFLLLILGFLKRARLGV